MSVNWPMKGEERGGRREEEERSESNLHRYQRRSSDTHTPLIYPYLHYGSVSFPFLEYLEMVFHFSSVFVHDFWQRGLKNLFLVSSDNRADHVFIIQSNFSLFQTPSLSSIPFLNVSINCSVMWVISFLFLAFSRLSNTPGRKLCQLWRGSSIWTSVLSLLQNNLDELITLYGADAVMVTRGEGCAYGREGSFNGKSLLLIHFSHQGRSRGIHCQGKDRL